MDNDDDYEFTIQKLRTRLNNLGTTGLDFIITDITECHNNESALTLEKFNIDDTIISVPINGFKYCYTIKELVDLIENAMDKYERNNPGQEATISNITIKDLYTNVNIPTDILQKAYNYHNGIIKVDTLEQIFIDSFNGYDENINNVFDFIIEIIQNNRDIVINATYDFTSYIGTNKMSPLQKACERNLTKVAMYILNNFTPKECLLDYADTNEKTALMYAISGLYGGYNEDNEMYKVIMKMLEYSPEENNLFYIGGDLHDNKTTLMIACHNKLNDIAIKILEKKPSIDYVNVRSAISSENQEGLYFEESTEGKTAIDYAVRNDMDDVLNKLVELYGPSMKREKKSNMYGFDDDLFGYDSRLFEFQPRGNFGGRHKMNDDEHAQYDEHEQYDDEHEQYDDDHEQYDDNQYDEQHEQYDDNQYEDGQKQNDMDDDDNLYRKNTDYISKTARNLGKSALNVGSMMKNKFTANKGRMASAAKSVGRSVTNTFGNIIKCIGKEAFKDSQDGGKRIRYMRKKRREDHKLKNSKKRRISSKK